MHMIVLQPDRILLLRQIEHLAPEMSGSLLDIGAGEKKRYIQLFSQVDDYRTLDTNADFKPDIVGSAEEIPLEDAGIDSVLCTQVLEHVPHPDKALKEIARVLRTGGKVIITIPQWNELHEEPHDYFRYTCFGIRKLCEEAGLTVIDVQQRGGYHACLAQMRIRHMIDLFRPYERKWLLPFLMPLSFLYTHWALWRDSMDKSKAGRKHAIGWAVLAQKPS